MSETETSAAAVQAVADALAENVRNFGSVVLTDVDLAARIAVDAYNRYLARRDTS